MKVVVQIVEKVVSEAHIKQVAIRKSQVAGVKKISATHKTLNRICSASSLYFQPPRLVCDITCDLRPVICDLV